MARLKTLTINGTLYDKFGEQDKEATAAVLYTEQTLTNEQKAQARANIGAIASVPQLTVDTSLDATSNNPIANKPVTQKLNELAQQDTLIQESAASAHNTAESAVLVANEAKTKAESALSTATGANTTANTASSNATTALNTANSANTTAGEAKTKAESALSTANTANTTANTAKNTADTANTNASTALTAANEAKSSVSTLSSKVTSLEATVENIPTDAHINSLITAQLNTIPYASGVSF